MKFYLHTFAPFPGKARIAKMWLDQRLQQSFLNDRDKNLFFSWRNLNLELILLNLLFVLKNIGLVFTGAIFYLTYTAWKGSVCGVLLVRIFPYVEWIRRDTEYLCVFSPNVGKYGLEKFRIRTLFTQCWEIHLG